jgi:hypothetical protein
MAEPKLPKDLVITYVVDASAPSAEYNKVGDALAKGYRVVDVLTAASHSGGQGGPGFVSVTVVLTKNSDMKAPYKFFHRTLLI